MQIYFLPTHLDFQCPVSINSQVLRTLAVNAITQEEAALKKFHQVVSPELVVAMIDGLEQAYEDDLK